MLCGPGTGTFGSPLEASVKKALFPSRSLRPLFDYARAAGGFGSTIWFELEDAQPRAPRDVPIGAYPAGYVDPSGVDAVVDLHPTFHYAKRSYNDTCGDNFVFALANPAAVDWMKQYVVSAARAWRFDVFRIERTCGGQGACTAIWRDNDHQQPAASRNGSTELHHVAGLYAVLDALRTAVPSVVVDNCAGGGESVDLDMLGRSIKKWRSDYDCTSDTVQHYAIANQVHTMSLSFFQPMNAGACLCVMLLGPAQPTR